MSGLVVETRNGGGQVLVSVHGEVDLATAPELEAALERALSPEAATLIVDLRGVSFLDSTGLALLVRHDRMAATAGGRMIVVKGPAQVQSVFEITRVSELLTMVDEPLA